MAVRLNAGLEPRWLDLGSGVRVKVRPLTTALYEAAKAKGHRLAQQVCGDELAVTAAGGQVVGLPSLQDVDGMAGLSQMLFAQALASQSIIEWEGVLAPDCDDVAEVTEDSTGDLMLMPLMAESFLIEYTAPLVELALEGNALRPAPNGTVAAGRDSAQSADKKGPPVPAAGEPMTGGDAHTGNTNPKQ